MEKKFVAPVSAFLTGIGLWIVLVILRLTKAGLVTQWPWLGTAVCIAAGILVLVSGLLCLLAGGPFMGQIVRMIVLIGLGVYSYFEVGKTAWTVAAIAAAGAVVLSVRAFTSGGKTE
jgi:hypothetical protein